MEHQAEDYDIDFGIHSKPGAPDYNSRVESCRKSLEESTILKAESSQSLKNLDGRTIKQEEAFDFEKEFKRRKNYYLKYVTAKNSFIKAKLDFDITAILNE